MRSDRTAFDNCLAAVDECDLFLGLITPDYGTGRDGKARQRSFSVSISKQLSPELSLQAGYQWTQANNVGADNTARANSVNVSLQYDWSKLDLTR